MIHPGEDEAIRRAATIELAAEGWEAGHCLRTATPGGRAFLARATRGDESLQAGGESPGRAWADLILLVRAEGPRTEPDPTGAERKAHALYRLAYDRASAAMMVAERDKIGRLDAASMARALGVERQDERDLILRAIEDAEIGRPPLW